MDSLHYFFTFQLLNSYNGPKQLELEMLKPPGKPYATMGGFGKDRDLQIYVQPPKFNSSPLKNGGWKTVLSYWVPVTFQHLNYCTYRNVSKEHHISHIKPNSLYQWLKHAYGKYIPCKSKDYFLNGFSVKTIVFVGIYNQQFQGTIILMVFDFQGIHQFNPHTTACCANDGKCS